jgi:hypothetical protein
MSAAEAARIVAFIAILLPSKGAAALASTTAMKVTLLFCSAFADRPANIAIYCKLDLPLAPRGPRKENCRYVGKYAANPYC